VPQRLAETSGGENEPLEIHGKRLIDCYDQLVGILRNRLGQNHAHFFAQPRVGASGSITWFTPLPGAVVRADELPPEERQRLEERAQRILGDVHGVATDIQSQGPGGQMIADMLRAAAQIAPRAPLYSIDGKPVVTLWGHRSSGAAVASAAPALRAEPAAAAPASAVSSAVARGTAPASTPSSPAPAASQAGPIPSKATTAGATGMRSYQRVALFAASALVLLAALFWGWRQFTMRAYDKTASAGDIDAQITRAEARNRLLESEIARLKTKGAPAVKCVPDSKKN
jgi:hypothetical protein